VIKSDIHLSMHNAYALVRVENWFSNHRSNQSAISWNVNCLWFLSSLPDASGKSLLRKLGFGYMLSPMVAYTLRIIMQAIPARVIPPTCSIRTFVNTTAIEYEQKTAGASRFCWYTIAVIITTVTVETRPCNGGPGWGQGQGVKKENTLPFSGPRRPRNEH